MKNFESTIGRENGSKVAEEASDLCDFRSNSKSLNDLDYALLSTVHSWITANPDKVKHLLEVVHSGVQESIMRQVVYASHMETAFSMAAERMKPLKSSNKRDVFAAEVIVARLESAGRGGEKDSSFMQNIISSLKNIIKNKN